MKKSTVSAQTVPQPATARNEIVVYQPDETIRLDVRLENETVWLTQEQIANLFGTKRPAITKHLANIYKSGELEREGTCSILEHMGNDGKQVYRSVFAARHILSAKKSIFLIDSWVDVVTLELLAKKAKGVTVEIVTSRRGNKISTSDIAKFNAQHGGLLVRTSKNFHDRFLIIDDTTLFLVGALLKDLGCKCFAFAKLDASFIPALKARV